MNSLDQYTRRQPIVAFVRWRFSIALVGGGKPHANALRTMGVNIPLPEAGRSSRSASVSMVKAADLRLGDHPSCFNIRPNIYATLCWYERR